MRIISGKHKGRRISAPKKLPVRPTTDMAKEALFNILSNQYYFEDISVLDLFSGTGNISYEFASRGVTAICSVDRNYDCAKFVKTTAEHLGFTIKTIKSDVFQFLEKGAKPVDIIFADPPYALSMEDFSQIPAIVFSKQLLLQNGTLIIEHAKHTDLSGLAHFKSSRKYGSSVFSFFEKK